MEVVYVTQTQPKFLTIYNTLYKEIQIGKYPSGHALPTEKELCARFDVSRMTLRQAIKLLAEDGIVESTRGKGHFVIPQTNAQHASSMDQFKHPLDQILLARVSMSSINYRVDLESEYTNHLFANHPSAVIAMERYYQKKDNHSKQADAFCFTFIPLNVIDTFKVNTQNEDDMKTFVEQTIYSNSYQSDLKMSITKAPHFKNHSHVFDGDTHCWLIIETLYAQTPYPIMINKWYIPQEISELTLTRIRQSDY
ncbi:GntR family transcriptional regulator [Staphylococcus aureus]|uniref:GntR family transcriptional regulator n=1 Tax=Staphylococcus aureus TaxID=1280 RepID=UPI0037E66320|nr:GntR family transcriptional regulator [Staphylococcus aureus]HDD0125930.1 GntR family transcriptional regulator [Staphylococcus aureus]